MGERTFYERFLRPALFRLPGEMAHDLGKATLQSALPWRWMARGLRVADARLVTRVGALALENPIGVSAGLDKNAAALPGLMQLGFGAITVGSSCPSRGRATPSRALSATPSSNRC